MKIGNDFNRVYGDSTIQRSSATKAISPVDKSLSDLSNTQNSLVDTQLSGVATGEVVDKEKLKSAVDAANKFLEPVANNLQFSIDEDSGRTVVKIIDTATKQVVRQMPSAEMLALNKALDKLQGVMITQEV